MDPKQDWIVDVDAHVIEPVDLWTSRLPAKYADVAPRVVHEDDADYWLYEDIKVGVSGLVTNAGAGPDGYNPMPIKYDEIRPSCYDPNERLKIMDQDSILAQMVFPNFPRFCGQTFYEAKDKELALLGVQAYNDFLTEEWAGADPGRMLACMILPLWDPQLAAKEIRRCAAKGARSITFSEYPPALGLPSIHDPGDYWGPVFEAAAECDMPLSIHIGSSSTVPTMGPDAPVILVQVLTRWKSADTAADWTFSNNFQRHPNLKIALSEGGIGWMPQYIEAADYAVHHYKYYEGYRNEADNFLDFVRRDAGDSFKSWPHDDLSPLDVFRRNIRGCFVGGLAGYADYTRSVIERYGSDIFIVETDYPHIDSSYPNTSSTLNDVLKTFSEDEQKRLRRDNAIEWYGLEKTAPLSASIS